VTEVRHQLEFLDMGGEGLSGAEAEAITTEGTENDLRAIPWWEGFDLF
jgi:hypothetical protein